MKKTILTLSLAASVLALAACGNDDEKVVESKVGDITKDELYQEMKASAGDQAIQLIMIEKVLEDKYEVSDDAIDEKYKEQKKSIEDQGSNFDDYLSSQGMSKDTFKRYVKLNLLQEEAMREGVKVSDEEIATYKERLGTEVKASHILVEDEKTAKKVLKELEDGKKFSALAKKYSSDTSNAEDGGELGWFGPDDMVAEFTTAVYDMKKGDISEPVKTDYGYHIIKLEDTRKADVKLSDEEIKSQLQLTKAKSEDSDSTKMQQKLSKLMKDADIEINDEDLKDALASYTSSSN